MVRRVRIDWIWFCVAVFALVVCVLLFRELRDEQMVYSPPALSEAPAIALAAEDLELPWRTTSNSLNLTTNVKFSKCGEPALVSVALSLLKPKAMPLKPGSRVVLATAPSAVSNVRAFQGVGVGRWVEPGNRLAGNFAPNMKELKVNQKIQNVGMFKYGAAGEKFGVTGFDLSATFPEGGSYSLLTARLASAKESVLFTFTTDWTRPSATGSCFLTTPSFFDDRARAVHSAASFVATGNQIPPPGESNVGGLPMHAYSELEADPRLQLAIASPPPSDLRDRRWNCHSPFSGLGWIETDGRECSSLVPVLDAAVASSGASKNLTLSIFLGLATALLLESFLRLRKQK